MLFLFLGNGGAWAQDIVVETLDFTAKIVSHSNYTDTWSWNDWSIMGGANNSNGWAYVRFGGKSSKSGTNVSKSSTITTKSLVENPVDYINIEHLGINGKRPADFKVSSITLETSTDADFKTITSKTTVTDADLLSSETTKTLQILPNSQIPENNYYRITIYWSTTNTNNMGLDIQKVLLMKKENSVPSIIVSNVEYAADITSGEIPYTINNPVEGTQLTASTTDEWISNVAVDDANDKVTFDMTENTETTPRTGTITLKYGDDVTKDVTVTQGAAVAKYTVTIETPQNGTLKVLRGEEEVVSGSLIPTGTELTIVPIPAEGYKFRNWQAVTDKTITYSATFTYTVDARDVTFKANFDEIVYHTVTWSVNGVETTNNMEEGTDIPFFTPTENIPEGYVFKGWYGSTLEPQDEAPEFVATDTKAMADVTYYAVFAKQSGEGTETTIEITKDQIKAASDADASQRSSYKDRSIGDWTGKFSLPLSSSNYSVLINRTTSTTGGAYNSHLTTPLCSAPIKSITINTNRGTSAGRIVYLCASGDVGAAGESDAVYGTATLGENDGTMTIDVKGNPTQLHIYSSATFYMESISLTYGEDATFSDYRTSVTDAPTTATITLAAACTDGTMYYGTYSSSKAFVVSDDIIVSEISVIDNKLVVGSYETGAVVPANTGVMVAALEAGEHTVNLSEEAGTSVLGTENMLRPSGDEGITAEAMAAANGDCKFYRLTMHKGTTLGYYWGAADGAAFALAANKAYLAVPAAVAAKISGFGIDGSGTTSIGGIAEDASKNGVRKIYNLQGQRVAEHPAKGLYIVDGRKVMIK